MSYARTNFDKVPNLVKVLSWMRSYQQPSTIKSHSERLKSSLQERNPLFLPFLLILSLLGVGLILYATTRGPGVGGDAAVYLASAKNLLAGRGLGLVEPDGGFRLIPYTPPLYPLMLALLGAPGFDMLQVARWFSAMLFGATIFLVGSTFYRFTRSTWFALAIALILVFSPILMRVYAWAMSEPLFLFTGFLGLFLAIAYVRTPGRSLLVGAAVACGLSFLARYIGAGFLGAGGLVILLLGRHRWGRRIGDAVLFGAIGFAPMAVWLAIDFLQTNTVASRSMHGASVYLTRLLSAFPLLKQVGINWLVPDSWIDAPPYPFVLNNVIFLGAIAAIFLLSGVVLWLWRAHASREMDGAWREDGRVLLAAGLGILVAVYLAVTLAVYVVTYPSISLDNRMLAPIHIAVLAFVTCLACLLTTLESRRRWVTAVAWLALVVIAGNYIWRGPRIALGEHNAGLGFMMDVWRDSPTVAAMKEIPGSIPIITNETTAVLFFTGRAAYTLQEAYALQPIDLNAVYGSDPSQREQKAFRQGAALVLFDTIRSQISGLYGDNTQMRLDGMTHGLRQAFRGDDGAVYYAR
ncbi:MAG: phospholipid carrier-dependent glycosyltransferase [Anaerolineaceae bacterium]|nr:phospholipid carrier-dependent glycosyltransferase [Anaerolineaceae bacterium]